MLQLTQVDLYTQVVELPSNLFKYPSATAEDPPGVQVNLVGSRYLKTPLEMPPFACFTQGQWSDPANISYIVLHCVFSLLFSHPHPSPPPPRLPVSPPPGLHVLPDPARGKVCRCPRSLPYFCLFLAFSLRLVISVFSQPSSLSHLGLGGLSCPNNTNRSLRKEERGGRRRRRLEAGVRKKKDTKRPKIGGLREQIKKKSDSVNYHPGFSKLPARISPTGEDCG